VTVLRDGRHVSTRAIGEHTHDSLIQDMIGGRSTISFRVLAARRRVP